MTVKDDISTLVTDGNNNLSFSFKIILSKAYKENEFKRWNIRPVTQNGVVSLLIDKLTKKKSFTESIKSDQLLATVSSVFPRLFRDLYILLPEETITYRASKSGGMKRMHQYTKNNILGHVHHNVKKRDWIQNDILLERLGLISSNGLSRPKQSNKIKQISRFIEILDHHLPNDLKERRSHPISITDFGSGKAYLSFAVYNYFKKILNLPIQLSGVEMDSKMTDYANNSAKELGYEAIRFHSSLIEEYDLEHSDIIIALHACDTATDDALVKSIRAKAKLIIASPCCHKQIRPQLEVPQPLQFMTKYGIQEERFAEMITDTLRALLLNYYGYQTKIMEYVSSEHTHKNLLLIAVKNKDTYQESALRSLKSIMSEYNIKKFRMMELLSL